MTEELKIQLNNSEDCTHVATLEVEVTRSIRYFKTYDISVAGDSAEAVAEELDRLSSSDGDTFEILEDIGDLPNYELSSWDYEETAHEIVDMTEGDVQALHSHDA